MTRAMLLRALSSAVAIVCATDVIAQCVDQWHIEDPDVVISGAARDVFGPFFRAGDHLYAFANGPQVVTQTLGNSTTIIGEGDVGATHSAAHLVRWDGRQWQVVPESRILRSLTTVGPWLADAVEYEGGIFVAGDFDAVEHREGGITQAVGSHSIARWDLQTQAWDKDWSLDHRGVWGGLGGWVSDLEVFGDRLFVLGSFVHHYGALLGNPPAQSLLTVANGLTSFSHDVWKGLASPPLGQDGPPSSGWVRVAGGRNFNPTMHTWANMEMFGNDENELVVHVTGVRGAFLDPNDDEHVPLTCPDGHFESEHGVILRLCDDGPTGYWEVLPGHFDDDINYEPYQHVNHLRLILHRWVDDENDMLVVGGSYDTLNSALTPERLHAWDGAGWTPAAHLRSTPPPHAKAWEVWRLADRRSHAVDPEVLVLGSFGSAQGAADSAPVAAMNIVAIRNGVAVPLDAPSGSIRGLDASGMPDGNVVFNRMIIVGNAIKTNAAPSSGVHLVVWGAPLRCAGDANGDFVVNFLDMNAVLGAYGAAAPDDPKDLNDDGVIDFLDLNMVLSGFGSYCCQ